MRSCSARQLFLACVYATALAASPSFGHGYKSGGITLEHPYIVVKAGSTQAALQFVRVRNAGPSADRLLHIGCAEVAAVSFHRTRADGGMQREPSIDLPANSVAALRHDGARHVMLDGVTRALAEGDALHCTAVFERAPDLPFEARVQTPRGSAAKDAGAHAGH